MEYFDVLDENGEKTGKIKLRDDVHKDGDWHRVAHIWIVNNDGEVLLQRRSKDIEVYPDIWDMSCAGHLSAGDDSIDGALRELKEEVGFDIDPKELQFVKTTKKSTIVRENYIDNEFEDLYILRTDKKIEDIKFPEDEISAVKFVPYKEFKKMVNENDSDLLRRDHEFKMLFDIFDEEFDK